MKSSVNLVIKYVCIGISWGCTFFVFFCLFFFIAGGEAALAPILKEFAKQAVGAIIVGIASGTTAIVYQFERFSGITKTAIHFGVGMGVFYPTALYLGWIPLYPDKILFMVLEFLLSCGIFMTIWFCFYLFNRNEAKKINARLRELERDRDVPGNKEVKNFEDNNNQA